MSLADPWVVYYETGYQVQCCLGVVPEALTADDAIQVVRRRAAWLDKPVQALPLSQTTGLLHLEANRRLGLPDPRSPVRVNRILPGVLRSILWSSIQATEAAQRSASP